jgi:hypothetical protein
MAQSSDRIEVFGGYTYLNPDFSPVSPNHVNGWNASANFKVRPWLGFVADFSGFYPSHFYPGCGGCSQGATISGTSYTFLFGPQFSLRRGRFSPFALVTLPSDVYGSCARVGSVTEAGKPTFQKLVQTPKMTPKARADCIAQISNF